MEYNKIAEMVIEKVIGNYTHLMAQSIKKSNLFFPQTTLCSTVLLLVLWDLNK